MDDSSKKIKEILSRRSFVGASLAFAGTTFFRAPNAFAFPNMGSFMGSRSPANVCSWGYNANGQLGDGTNSGTHYSPYNIFSTSPSWLQISAGQNHGMGIRNDNTLWTWGTNSDSQMGIGTTTSAYTPVQVSGGGWAQISTGAQHTLAIKQDGTLWAWGANYYGQLGNGNTATSNIPIQIGSSQAWKSVAAGGSHSAAIDSDGSLWCWGHGASGELGPGSSGSSSPIHVTGQWAQVALGQQHTLGLKTDGSIYSWGNNSNGQLGDGTTTNRNAIQQIGSAANWIAVRTSSMSAFSGAIQSDGTLFMWGSNTNGQIGNGSSGGPNVTSPFAISTTQVLDVQLGSTHTVAIGKDMSLWSWGNNYYGAAGNGTSGAGGVGSPTQITGKGTWGKISAGFNFNLGIKLSV